MSEAEGAHKPAVEHLQRLHRRRMAVFGLVILAAGIAIGAAGALIIAPGKVMQPPRPPEWMIGPLIESIDRDLGLSPEQKAQIRPIVKNHMEKMGQLMQQGREKFYELWGQLNKNIAAVLTEEQLKAFNHRLEEVQRRMRSHRRGGPRRGVGGRRGPGDANRPPAGRGPFGPGWRPGDPNRPYRGPGGQFGPGFKAGDPNRPRWEFGRDPNRFRRGGGPYGYRQDPNRFEGGYRRGPERPGARPRPGDSSVSGSDANLAGGAPARMRE